MVMDQGPSRIIGGMFGLESDVRVTDQPPFWHSSQLLLVNARSGLRLLIETKQPAQVWLPSYLCDVMVAAVQAAGKSPRFYPIDTDLKVSDDTWLSEVQPKDLVVAIDYFGFSADRNAIDGPRQRGARIVEDAAQALLSSHVGKDSDFVLFSPRKFVGVPDGGILRVDDASEWADLTPPPPPERWWLKAVTAGVLRKEFDQHGGDRRWFRLFQETELTAPTEEHAMSTLTRAMLQHSFDYSAIARQRVSNYLALAKSLGQWALYPSLPLGVVPLGFPVRLKARDQVRQVLFEEEIYPPVHWALAGVVPELFRASHLLSAEILTLPCDQRYNEQDMERISKILLREVGG